MDELFDAHFDEDGKRLIYKLTPEQSAAIYRSIGEYLATADRAEGFDITFREEDDLTGKETTQIFKLDTTQTFTLYRRLGAYLQKRYPGSESLSPLHEIMI